VADCQSAIEPITNRRYIRGSAAPDVARTGSPLYRRLATGEFRIA